VSRPILIVVVFAIAATATSGATICIVKGNTPAPPKMSKEQRITREKIFGTAGEPPPIEKGQEMRPQW
jgi:type IV secretion system protein TrbK